MNIAEIRDKLKTIAEKTVTTTSGNVGDPVKSGLIKQPAMQQPKQDTSDPEGNLSYLKGTYRDPRKEAELQRTIAQMQANLGDAEAFSKEVAQQEIENSAKMAARAQELANMGVDVNQQLPKQVKDPESGEMVDLDADDLEVRLNYLGMQKGLPMLDLGYKGQSGELSSEFGRDFQRDRIATRQRELDRLGLTNYEIDFIRKARSGDPEALATIKNKKLLDKDPETGEYLMYKTIKPGQDPAYAV